jgi:hypothetical protein
MGNFFFLSSGYFKWNYHAKEKNEDCDCEESDGNDEGENEGDDLLDTLILALTEHSNLKSIYRL